MSCARVLVGITCFLQLVAAAGVITVTAWKLHNVTINIDAEQFTGSVDNVCLLGTTDNGANLCYFAYGVSGVSVIATAVLSLLQCVTCRLCGLGSLLDAIFAAAGTAIWAIAGVIFRHYGSQPVMQAVPRPEWRMAIPILSFAACALFGLMCLAALWALFASCCSCCGGGGGSGRRSRGDVEAGKAAGGAYHPGAAPAGYPPQGQFVVGHGRY